ncbi:MAG: hypothetical protein WD226_05725 [Planctomycetota bacterium]
MFEDVRSLGDNVYHLKVFYDATSGFYMTVSRFQATTYSDIAGYRNSSGNGEMAQYMRARSPGTRTVPSMKTSDGPAWIPARSQVVLGSLVLGFIACRTVTPASVVPIEGNDTSTTLSTLRTSYRLGNSDVSDANFPDFARAGKFVELQVEHAEGDFDQSLAGMERIVLDSVSFVGPVDVEADVAYSQASARFRYRRPLGQGFGVEAVGGLAVGTLALDVRSASQSASEEFRTYGLVFGGTMTQTPLAWLQLRAGIETSLLFVRDGEEMRAAALELSALVRVSEHVRLFGGWRALQLDVEFDRGSAPFLDASSVESTLSGVWLGLWLAL